MIIFPVEGDKGHLPYERVHLTKTLQWLQENEKFNIKNFKEGCTLVDETLDYQANDYEARNTLTDLYECVLYADVAPSNIQLREGKPITLVVIDPTIGHGRKKEEIIKNAIRKTNIQENSINTDIKYGWHLHKEKILKYELSFNREKKSGRYKKLKSCILLNIMCLKVIFITIL